MEMTITNFRGETNVIQLNACVVEQTTAIAKILADIGIMESESEISKLFADCRHIANYDRVEYVLSHLTAKNYSNSNVLSVFISAWRDWLINKMWRDNPEYSVETSSMRQYDFREELDGLVDRFYEEKSFYPKDIKPDDWRIMLIMAAEN